MSIEPTDTVDAVMRRWPKTIAIFLRNRMRCIGCPVGRIHSLADASREHGLDLARLIGELSDVRDGAPIAQPPAAAPEAEPPTCRPAGEDDGRAD